MCSIPVVSVSFFHGMTNVFGRVAVPPSALADTPLALEKTLRIALCCTIRPGGG